MSFKAGDSRKITVSITDEMVRKFADMSGDHNPIHLDEEYAAKTRYKRRIAHGMICGALISRALAHELGLGGIYLSQNLKFIHPVFIGDTIDVELKVLAVRESKGIGTIETNCRNQNGELCVKGEAIIMKAENV